MSWSVWGFCCWFLVSLKCLNSGARRAVGVSGGLFGDIWVKFRDSWGAGICSEMCLSALSLCNRAGIEQSQCIGQALKCKACFTWQCWDIKISKCLYIGFKKIIEFYHFSVFLCPSERNHKIHLYQITLYQTCKPPLHHFHFETTGYYQQFYVILCENGRKVNCIVL